MHRSTDRDDSRRDRATALIALALLALLSAYHLWDVRAAFSDFDGWWAYVAPEHVGDDYVEVIRAAENPRDWHTRFRSVSLGMGIRRSLDDVETLVVPEEFWRLSASSPDTTSTVDDPGIKEDYFESVTSQAEHLLVDYDPVLGAPVIDEWRAKGWVTDLVWMTAYVSDGIDDDAVVLHTDETHTWVYAVPAHLSPVSPGDGGGE